MEKTKFTILASTVIYLSMEANAGSIRGSTAIATGIFNVTIPVLCGIYMLLAYIAGGIAMFVLVYAGIQWIGSQDDPGMRKNAKTMIVYTVVGLIIVLIAASLVSLVISGEILPC